MFECTYRLKYKISNIKLEIVFSVLILCNVFKICTSEEVDKDFCRYPKKALKKQQKST